ncbi:MAG TPA: hypothetical protein VFG04_25965 [Planctomycetaceae bacterium]|jgi:hypothetical protein|nr:hypothetical protein [Planctomycetaceae bacterium]
MRYELKPLGVGGTLDQAIAIFKDRPGLFVLITLILRIPLTAVLQYHVLVNLANFPMQPNDAQLNEFFGRFMRLYLFVLGPSLLVDLLLISPITNASLIYATARIYLGEPIGVWQALRMALRRYFPYVWTTVLFAMIVFLGTLCCILPGILLAFRFALAPNAAVLERVSGFGALQRSADLMRSEGYTNYLKYFGLIVVLGFIQGGINAASNFVPQLHLRAAAIGLFGSISITFAIVAQVVFYYSCRCRNEGFDLLYLARIVAETPNDQSVVPAQA